MAYQWHIRNKNKNKKNEIPEKEEIENVNKVKTAKSETDVIASTEETPAQKPARELTY